MMGHGAERAFRAQLFLPEQRQLFDYWLSRRGSGNMPSRDDISPTDFPSLLPYVSILELRERPDIIRFRLAGTALWDMYGGEMTGCTLADADRWGGNHEYWQRNYSLIAEEMQPAAGMLKAPSNDREHLVQFWIRLPLAGGEGRPDMLLGLDMCVAASRLKDSAGACENAVAIGAN